MLVDNCGLQLVIAPERFDVILTENTFEDILSDVAAGKTGGLGLAASASLGDGGADLRAGARLGARHRRPGHPNPAAMLRSAALMLAHGLDRPEEAARLEAAVDGARRRPHTGSRRRCSTSDFVEAVLAGIRP